MITRRLALQNLALATGAVVLSSTPAPVLAQEQKAEADGVFKLPPLGYDYDALEPHIDAETMKLHHDKHHATYVSKLNQAIAKAPGVEKKSIEEILGNLSALPEDLRKEVRNNGGGHSNHALFWQHLKKEGGKPQGELEKAIEKEFGGLSGLQEKLTAASLGVFGSGWAWLSLRSGKLTVEGMANQDSPYLNAGIPLMGIDVWEHAYYLKYQNRRADYVKAIFNVINWDFVSDRYAKLAKA